jgi:AhpD family alkylhydroperoxidase
MRRDEVAPSVEEKLAAVERAGNTVPNSMLTMARVPAVLEEYASFSATVFAEGEVTAELKRLLAHVASAAAGCTYCSVHNSLRAERLGASEQRLAEVWEFRTSPRFSPAERAALELAIEAAQCPNEVNDESFDRARSFYSDAALVEIVAVLSLTAFTNRWNETMRTEFEAGLGMQVDADAPATRLDPLVRKD